MEQQPIIYIMINFLIQTIDYLVVNGALQRGLEYSELDCLGLIHTEPSINLLIYVYILQFWTSNMSLYMCMMFLYHDTNSVSLSR